MMSILKGRVKFGQRFTEKRMPWEARYTQGRWRQKWE